MKPENIKEGKRYWVGYGCCGLTKARCISSEDGVFIFRLFWPFPFLTHSQIRPESVKEEVIKVRFSINKSPD